MARKRLVFASLILNLLAACNAEVSAPATSISLGVMAPSDAAFGSIVTFSVAITNLTNRDIAVPLSSIGTEAVDLSVISTASGEVVWSRFSGNVIGVGGALQLEAGATRQVAIEWSSRDFNGDFVPAGKYTVLASLRGEDNVKVHAPVATLVLRGA